MWGRKEPCMQPHPAALRLAIAAAALLLLSPAARAAGDAPPASPAQPPARPAPEVPAKAGDEPKMVCESVQQMGSHFRRKVCATPEAWEARRRKDAAQMERMGDQGTGCGGVANPC